MSKYTIVDLRRDIERTNRVLKDSGIDEELRVSRWTGVGVHLESTKKRATVANGSAQHCCNRANEWLAETLYENLILRTKTVAVEVRHPAYWIAKANRLEALANATEFTPAIDEERAEIEAEMAVEWMKVIELTKK